MCEIRSFKASLCVSQFPAATVVFRLVLLALCVNVQALLAVFLSLGDLCGSRKCVTVLI